jgi:hypothetical protein
VHSRHEHPYSALASAATACRRVIRRTSLVVIVAVATGAVTTIGLSSAAARGGPGGQNEFWAGADVSRAGVFDGRLHLTVTFHKAGTYVAVFVPGHTKPNGSSRGTNHTDLGQHAAGAGHLSIPLATLPGGPWSVFVGLSPLRHALVFMGSLTGAATWVHLTKYANGQVTVGSIVTP